MIITTIIINSKTHFEGEGEDYDVWTTSGLSMEQGQAQCEASSQAHLQIRYLLNVFKPAVVNLHLHQMGGNSPRHF